MKAPPTAGARPRPTPPTPAPAPATPPPSSPPAPAPVSSSAATSAHEHRVSTWYGPVAGDGGTFVTFGLCSCGFYGVGADTPGGRLVREWSAR